MLVLEIVGAKRDFAELNALEFSMDQETKFAQLIEDLKNNEERAVEELVARYGPHIQRVVRRHLGRKMRIRFDSQDFAQAVWATLLVKSTPFGHIQTEPQLIAFLTQIAFHKVIDQRRANTLAQRRTLYREVSFYSEDFRSNQPDVFAETPSQFLIADEQLQAIQRELPADLQWMIECRMQGMTFVRIAKEGGLHERTVRRIFEQLKKRLETQ